MERDLLGFFVLFITWMEIEREVDAQGAFKKKKKKKRTYDFEVRYGVRVFCILLLAKMY